MNRMKQSSEDIRIGEHYRMPVQKIQGYGLYRKIIGRTQDGKVVIVDMICSQKNVSPGKELCITVTEVRDRCILAVPYTPRRVSIQSQFSPLKIPIKPQPSIEPLYQVDRIDVEKLLAELVITPSTGIIHHIHGRCELEEISIPIRYVTDKNHLLSTFYDMSSSRLYELLLEGFLLRRGHYFTLKLTRVFIPEDFKTSLCMLCGKPYFLVMMKIREENEVVILYSAVYEYKISGSLFKKTLIDVYTQHPTNVKEILSALFLTTESQFYSDVYKLPIYRIKCRDQKPNVNLDYVQLYLRERGYKVTVIEFSG